MQPNAKRIALEHLAEAKDNIPPSYFSKVSFTSDEIEILVWHLANQKLQNSQNENSKVIFWNQIRFFKGFTEDLIDDKDFSWNENIRESVRIFNIFNQQYLGKLYVENRLTDEQADKAAIAGWFSLVAAYCVMSALESHHKIAADRYNKILNAYFPQQADQADHLIQDGLNAAREYLSLTDKQQDANARPMTWTEFLSLKS